MVLEAVRVFSDAHCGGPRVWLKKARARQRLKPTKQGKLRAESDLDMLRILVDSIMEYAIIMLDPKGQVCSAGAQAPNGSRVIVQMEVVGKKLSVFATRAKTPPTAPLTVELETATREGRSEDESWRVRNDGYEVLGQRCHHRAA